MTTFSAELYKHDLDQKAFNALSAFPKFIKLRESYIANVDEKEMKFQFLSSAIRLGEDQFPEIYNMLPPICEKLEISVPELYYVKSKEINAATGGSTNPYIFVTSEMVEKVPTDLIGTALAHECGHIACKHYLYHSMAGLLVNGIDKSPLAHIPAIRRYLTPTLVRAILFWDRCSELSADRAAVLCDGNADKLADLLLKLNGYEKVNRDAFLKQAMDLKAFVTDSESNQFIEKMLTQDETHPRLATRVYESHEWTAAPQFQEILDGTYTIEKRKKEESEKEETEAVAAEVKVSAPTPEEPINMDQLNAALSEVSAELDRYTNKADKADYAIGIISGIMAGLIDDAFVGETVITNGDIAFSHKQVNNFIQQYAEFKGFSRDRLKDAIGDLEKKFKVPQDDKWKGKIGVSAKNHHLADLAHHPTPLGLISSIIVQLLRFGTFVNKDGEWHFRVVDTTAKDMIEVLTPAIITGVLNWIVYLGEKKYEEEEERELPTGLHKIIHLAATTPIIIEFAKCADKWFGHLVSDMGGSKNTAGGGMGIPGVFLSLLYEFASLPIMKNTGLPKIVNDLYEKDGFDFRHEISLCHAARKQIIPVAYNEIYARLLYFLLGLEKQVIDHAHDLSQIDWKRIIPFHNRTMDRVLMIASMTFTVADTADAAMRAALESGGNWVLFSGKFVTRFNYAGAGRAAIAIVKEISNEKKETQLIHEKMILSEAKADIFLKQLQQFKTELEEKVTEYLAEDIENFMNGFDLMKQGISLGDSNMVIKGNVTIQRVLGREPQFTNQDEFDELMDSDMPLIL